MEKEECLKALKEFCRDTLIDNIGMEFTDYGEGWVEARMPIDRRTRRPDGVLHGGANMAMAETVGGVLSVLSLPEEYRNHVFGIEINGNHMKQAKGSYVIAHARFLHRGKRTHVVEVEIRDEFGTLVTVNRVTNLIV